MTVRYSHVKALELGLGKSPKSSTGHRSSIIKPQKTQSAYKPSSETPEDNHDPHSDRSFVIRFVDGVHSGMYITPSLRAFFALGVMGDSGRIEYWEYYLPRKDGRKINGRKRTGILVYDYCLYKPKPICVIGSPVDIMRREQIARGDDYKLEVYTG